MSALMVVAKKELYDLSRDRKTLLLTLFLSPLIVLLLIFGLSRFMEAKVKRESEKPLAIAIVGAERAPNLVAWLGGMGISRKEVADPDAAIRAEDEQVYLRIGDDYAQRWSAGEPAPVEVVADSTRKDAKIPEERLSRALELYSREVAALRLLARGVDPGISTPLGIANRDLATDEALKGSAVASFLPYLLLLGSLVGILAFVVDITAGERERQSLEPLLTVPARRSAIVGGKVVAAIALGLVGALMTCLAFKLGAKSGGAVGKLMELRLSAIATVLLVLVPMVAINACLLTVIAAAAKTVKEAQSYVSLLMLLPMLPSIFLMVNPVRVEHWMFAVPYLGQYQAIMKILRGETVTALEWLIYLAAALGLAALLGLLAVWRYRQERLAIAS